MTIAGRLLVKFFYAYCARKGVCPILLGKEDAALVFKSPGTMPEIYPAQAQTANGKVNSLWVLGCSMIRTDPTGLTCMRDALQDACVMMAPECAAGIDACWQDIADLKISPRSPKEST